MLKIIMDIVVP